MDRPMSSTYRSVAVPVAGGDLHVGMWGPEGPAAPTILAVHGVTSSHLAWEHTARHLPEVRVIAPDLRGRGRSNTLVGPAGMASHADDLAAVIRGLDVTPGLVVGHSMGGFVAVTFAHRHPELVSRLLLIDGGFPLAAPAGLSADQLVAAILGPTAERLQMRFADVDDYLAFWHPHPAFAGVWDETLERYFAYDLVADGDRYRPATSYATTVEDTVDLNGGSSAFTDAVAGLRHPTRFVTVPRGLRDETPGLYPTAHRQEVLAAHPDVRHEEWAAFNHYTAVMSDAGGAAVAGAVREELGLR